MHPALAEHLRNSIINEDIKVPSSWKQQPHGAITRTELKQMQRNEFIPHKSYDLDGDGSVGNRDYVNPNFSFILGSQ